MLIVYQAYKVSNRFLIFSREYFCESLREFIIPLLTAVSLLTCLPVAHWLPAKLSNKLLGRSVLWYPVVGLLLAGLLLLLLMLFTSTVSPFVVAVTVVIVWVALTGGLHLDGLADCVDALYAGHSVVGQQSSGPPKLVSLKQLKILQVLKDPCVGAMGAVAIMLLLMLKVSVVASLSTKLVMGLLLAMVLSRSCALLFIVMTPYTPHASTAGVGAILAVHAPKSVALVVILLVALITFFVLPFFIALILLASQFILCFVFRFFWVKRLDGFVGDAVGALIELSEVSVLFVFYLLVV